MHRSLLLIVVMGFVSNVAAMEEGSSQEVCTKKELLRKYLEWKKQEFPCYTESFNEQNPRLAYDDPRLKPPSKKLRLSVKKKQEYYKNIFPEESSNTK